MASSFKYQSNYDWVSVCSETRTLRRGSKSQMCLLRILRIITTVQPVIATSSPPRNDSETKGSLTENDTCDEEKPSGFDLSGEYLVLPETEESFAVDGSSSSTTETDGGAFKVNFEDGSFGGDQIDRGDKEEHENRVSESTHTKIERTEERSLTLLIEAAKLILGEFTDNKKSNSESESGKQSISRGSELKKGVEENGTEKRKLRERSRLWTAAEMGGDFEETPSSPVVRSKRGRTQVLPYKYRDSVIQPLTRLSRNRSSILPTKRRDR